MEILLASIFSFICIVLAFAYRYACKLYTYFDKREIPGPVPSFLLGTWKECTEKFLGDVDVENAKLYGKVYGTFDGFAPNVMITDPDIIKEVLLIHSNKFSHLRVRSSRNEVLKMGLSSLYGEEENDAKKTLFSDCKIEKVIPRLEEAGNRIVEKVRKAQEEGVAPNLMSMAKEYVEDAIASAVFGIDLNSDLAFKEELTSACDQVLATKNPNSKLSLIPFLYESVRGDSWIFPQKALSYFVNLIKTGIKDAGPFPKEGKGGNLIEVLMERAEEEKKILKGVEGSMEEVVLTEDCIIAKCISAILALSNSTRNVLLLTLHSLASHTELQDQLFKEIDKNKNQELNITNVQRLHLLDMIIAEVLRLYPSDFRVEMVCEEPVTIGKMNLVKGSRVSVPLYALHRDETHYPEHDKFDPSRFSQEAFENRNPFTYLPFGQAGVNSHSISVQLALLASKVCLSKLVESFKFKLIGDNMKPIFQKGVTGVPKLLVLNVLPQARNE